MPSGIPQENLDVLVDSVDGSFVYASTILRFIGDKDGSPTEQLSVMLGIGQGIDRLYEKILSMSPYRN